jgi:hypothetical protein
MGSTSPERIAEERLSDQVKNISELVNTSPGK